MLRFVLDDLCKIAVKSTPFVIRYITDVYKSREMCIKVFLEKSGEFKFVPDCYKNQIGVMKLLIIMPKH